LKGLFAGQFGLEYMYQNQDTRGAVPLSPAGTIRNFAGFIFEEATLGLFRLSLGLRLDRRSQEAEPDERLKLPDDAAGETEAVLAQTYQVVTGSIGGACRLLENLTLAANVGRGFRAPNLFELHVHGEHGGIASFQIGDPYLKEETSLSTELSVRWRSRSLQAKATVYRNAIDNYIYLVNTGVIDSGSQLPIMTSQQGDAALVGADLSAQAQVLPWLQLRGTFETVKGNNTDTNEDLPLLPATKFEGEARFTRHAWGKIKQPHLSLGVRHAAEKKAAGRFEPFWQFDTNPDFGVASTGAYTLIDLGFGCDLPLGDRYIHFDVGIKNLLNTAYRDFLDTYKGYALSPGRNVVFKLNVPFGT